MSILRKTGASQRTVPKPGRPLRAARGLRIVWLLAFAPLAGCQDRPGATAAQLDALAARCTTDMVQQNCRVMAGPAQTPAPPGSVLFVAGIGQIDAELYNTLRGLGEQMCSQVRQICSADWNGPRCATARALYDLDPR
jgi:hypothetical protein